ncbi:MAG: prepilin-type N-terminal cleavage/methylation domain-containing protein [Sedimentisphaerales bacterium]|nr:prepilin-type N-terminal cleavage/methylation domain-containing protein [Sedimentisphaerales bacterium]
MVKRALMTTCSAQMHTDCVVRDALCVIRTKSGIRNTRYAIRNIRCGFTLTELVVVLVIIGLFAFMVQMHLFGMLRKNTFKAQVQEFVSTMQMAASAAGQSDRRYEVIIDISQQEYMLREITNPDLTQVFEEEIIIADRFNANCRVSYVMFDDGESTSEDRAKFRTGHSGWQYGGKIVLLDENEQPYSVVVSRLNRMVTLVPGDILLLEPKSKDEVFF